MLRYILVYHKCLSVYSAVHFIHISKDNKSNYEISYKDVTLLKRVKKHSYVQTIAFNINLNNDTFLLVNNMQLSIRNKRGIYFQ